MRPLLLALSLALASSVFTASAEARPGRPAAEARSRRPAATAERPSPKKARARILREQVGLDDARARKVEKIMDDGAAERRVAQAERQKARHEVQNLLDADSKDDAAYAQALAAARAAEERLRRAREHDFTEISKVITPREQAKLLRALARVARRQRHRGR